MRRTSLTCPAASPPQTHSRIPAAIIREAANFHVEGILQDGEAIPEPRSADIEVEMPAPSHRSPLRAAVAMGDGCAILMTEKRLVEKLRTQSLWLLVLSMALFPVLSGCASEERVNALEQRILSLETQQAQQVNQQQQTVDNIHRWIVAFDEETELIDQRLAELSEADNRLSMVDAHVKQQVSELESRLDDRMINRVLATPWKVLGPAIALLLLGILFGVLFDRFIFVRATDKR